MTKEEIESKAKEPFPNDEFKQQIVIDAINWAIAELEKENASLKNALEGYKQIAKWCDKCDKIAELKSENQKWKDEWQEQVQKATDEGYARTLQTIQLTKAKRIIQSFVWWHTGEDRGSIDSNDLVERAEQFLNSEVEK